MKLKGKKNAERLRLRMKKIDKNQLEKNLKPIILYVTGARSDYGLMRKTLTKLNQIADVRIVLTAMHLSKMFGQTSKEVKKDGFRIQQKIPVKFENDSFKEMSNGISHVIMKLNELFSKIDVKFVVILGDRWEALATAIASKYNQIPIMHVAGGDISGSLDDYNRKAISIFSTFHFVENIEHKKRLVSYGISKKNIFFVGSPGIDQIKDNDFPEPVKILKKYNIGKNKFLIIVIFHSTYEEIEHVDKYIKIILNALTKFGNDYDKLVIYPNIDTGAHKIIQVLNNFKKVSSFHVVKNIPHNEFLSLMSRCSLMIGNSSSVFTEGMAFKIPAINLGVRQKDRIRGKNIIDCDYNEKKITKAIKLALSTKFKQSLKNAKNPYGSGKTAEKIEIIIKDIIKIK